MTPNNGMTLPEACIAGKLSWAKGYAAMMAGEFGTPWRDGRQWRVSRDAVEAYVTKHAK